MKNKIPKGRRNAHPSFQPRTNSCSSSLFKKREANSGRRAFWQPETRKTLARLFPGDARPRTGLSRKTRHAVLRRPRDLPSAPPAASRREQANARQRPRPRQRSSARGCPADAQPEASERRHSCCRPAPGDAARDFRLRGISRGRRAGISARDCGCAFCTFVIRGKYIRLRTTACAIRTSALITFFGRYFVRDKNLINFSKKRQRTHRLRITHGRQFLPADA